MHHLIIYFILFGLNAKPSLATFLAEKKKLPGLTHPLVVGVPDNIQTFVLYIQTSSMDRTHSNPQAQIPSNQMLQLTGTDRVKINDYHMLPNEGIEQGMLP